MSIYLPPRQWWVPVAIVLLGPLVGAALGSVTNAVNGVVSPRYFYAVTGWSRWIVLRAIGQGVLEGGALGGVFGVTVGIAFAASTRMRGGFELAWRALCLAAGLAAACWAIGGAVGVLLAVTRPDVFSRYSFRMTAGRSCGGSAGWAGRSGGRTRGRWSRRSFRARGFTRRGGQFAGRGRWVLRWWGWRGGRLKLGSEQSVRKDGG